MNETMMILNNEELRRALLTTRNAAELECLLEEHGLELKDTTHEKAFAIVQEKIRRAESGELSEEDLEMVTGGWYNIAGIVLQTGLTSAWASIAIPTVGILVAVGVGKHLISKAKNRNS